MPAVTLPDAAGPDATHVVTLVTHAIRLEDHHVAAVFHALPRPAAPRWLAPGIAADIAFAPPAAPGNGSWHEAARLALRGEPVDVVVQPLATRRKRLLIADMDATMIREECIDEVAALAGQGEAVAALTRASVRGETDFEESLRQRVRLLQGIDVERLNALADTLTPMAGATTLVATMRAHGAVAVLASGGFTLFTAGIAARLGFDEHHGNVLGLADGQLDGTLGEPILGRAAKATILNAQRKRHGIDAAATLAVGDGANDLAMLAEAGLGIAFHAAPAIAAAARARIDHSDLTALLYVQGYGASDLVERVPS